MSNKIIRNWTYRVFITAINYIKIYLKWKKKNLWYTFEFKWIVLNQFNIKKINKSTIKKKKKI